MGHLERPGVRAPAPPRGPRDSTRSSSAAARATSRRGWRGAARALVGIDNSERQLATARRLASQNTSACSSRCCTATPRPCPYPDGHFDFADQRIRCRDLVRPRALDPRGAPPAQARRSARLSRPLLPRDADVRPTRTCPRPSSSSAITSVMHRFDWPDADGAVEFALTHGDMIRLLRDSGFEVEDLVEVRAPEGAETPIRSARHRRVGEALADRGGVEGPEDGLTARAHSLQRARRRPSEPRGRPFPRPVRPRRTSSRRAGAPRVLRPGARASGRCPRPAGRTAPSPGSNENSARAADLRLQRRRDLGQPGVPGDDRERPGRGCPRRPPSRTPPPGSRARPARPSPRARRARSGGRAAR